MLSVKGVGEWLRIMAVRVENPMCRNSLGNTCAVKSLPTAITKTPCDISLMPSCTVVNAMSNLHSGRSLRAAIIGICLLCSLIALIKVLIGAIEAPPLVHPKSHRTNGPCSSGYFLK